MAALLLALLFAVPARDPGRTLAQRVQNPAFLLEAHRMFGVTSFFLGELITAHRHLEQHPRQLVDPTGTEMGVLLTRLLDRSREDARLAAGAQYIGHVLKFAMPVAAQERFL